VTEQQRYDVVRAEPGFELRRYPAHEVAEVEVEGTFEGAGNAAFRPLASYIGGRNASGAGLAMTAPVLQRRPESQEPEPQPQPSVETETTQTAPGRYVVSFVMPAGSSPDSLPVPQDARVVIRTVPEELAAAVRYSGRWTSGSYRQQVARLRTAVADAGLEVVGPPRFARFDPPWTPWFRRRNEVVLPVRES